MQFAVKDVCREMSQSNARSLRRLLRIACYLKMHPRLVWKFEYQYGTKVQDIYGDANWAACRKTEKKARVVAQQYGVDIVL